MIFDIIQDIPNNNRLIKIKGLIEEKAYLLWNALFFVDMF